MDPLADKLLCVTALVCLASSGKVNWIPVTFVITKEVLMLIGSVCLIKNGIVSQSQEIGKIAQWLMIVAISLSFFHNFFTNWIVPLDTILLWIAVVVALLALIFYAGKIAKAKKAVTVKSQEP
jgi:phosphatidylglycerophosphate synthase